MNASPHPDTPVCQAPLALWRVAEAFMRTLFHLFGGPENVAADHTLMKKPYKLLLTWLRVGEALMRRLVLIEASAQPKPNTPPILWPKRAHTPRLIAFYPDKPEDWRVSFRCLLDRRRPRRRSGGHERTPQRFFSAWPLAERYEALLRVFNDPTPYARRLARRLHAQPHRWREPLRAPPDAADKIGDAFAPLTECAETSALAFNSG